MKLRRQKTNPKYAQITDEEIIQLMRQFESLDYEDEQEEELVNQITFRYPNLIDLMAQPGITLEEALAKAKEARKTILL